MGGRAVAMRLSGMRHFKGYGIKIRASFYDSLFLALAEKEHVPILTLDKKLYNKAKFSHDVQLI